MNSRFMRTRLSMAAATACVAIGLLMAGGPASAAPAAGSPSSAHAARTSALPTAPSGAVTVKMPGADILCTSDWKGNGNNYLHNGGYTQVEWTSNPCGFSIQERSWCNEGGGSGYWSPSGIVFGTDVWDQSTCKSIISYANRGEVHFNHQDGTGWTTYQTFWTG
jgi:hypothetical protein